MPKAVRVGDTSRGHGCFTSTRSIRGDNTVLINGLKAVRVGDLWAKHCCGSCHSGRQLRGSVSVLIGGSQQARVGDAIDCGDYAATGSNNVITGG